VGEPRKLLFHVPSLEGGGAERVIVLVANEMARRGHDVVLFVWNKQGPNAAEIDARVRLVSLNMPIRNGGFGKRATISGLAKTIKLLREEQPDAVFSGLEFANLLMATSLAISRCRANFFPSYHAAAELKSNGIAYKLIPLLDRMTISRATKAIGVSKGVSADLVRRGFRPLQVVTINNPLQPQQASSSSDYPWQSVLASLGEGPVIACLGRLVPVKDHRTLIRAFAKVQQVTNCRLAIFGEGPLEPDLKHEAASLGIADKALFAGYVNEPAACYAVADIVVSSSTSEGFGNVLVEAMAAGVPVVSTDAPHGPREILADGLFGRLVPVGDADALAQAIVYALSSPTNPIALKARAADFSIEVIGDRYEALLVAAPNNH
jgi:glycosyltransferase involved in cell wall biosynthesis